MKLFGKRIPPSEGNLQHLHQKLRLLGYDFEVGKRSDAVSVLRDFQQKRGLPPTGKADLRTLRLIDEAVKALPPRTYGVSGKVVFIHGKEMRPLEAVTVRAFDRDLRREELLGESLTDAEGGYRIPYTSKQFARAEKARADLVVRVFSPEGVLLTASEPIVNASEEETVNLTVTPRDLPEESVPSEYELLATNLTPILLDVSLSDLTEEDIDFLVRETGAEQEHIRILTRSARLSEEAILPAEVFYGFGRRNLPPTLEALRALDLKTLRDALLSAVDQHIIPASLKPALDDILTRLKAPQQEQRPPETVLREFMGRLLTEETAKPLGGYTIRGYELNGDDTPQHLGYDVTDTSGLFALVFRITRETEATPRIALHVFDPQGKEVFKTVVEAGSDGKNIVEIRVPVPDPTSKPAPSLEELASAISLDLPTELRDVLNAHDIVTLEDIRTAGGLRHLDGLPDGDEMRPAINRLEAHANLSVLSPDAQVNDRLIGKGYTSVASIAGTPRTDFIDSIQEEIGALPAARLFERANSQNAYLHNLSTHVRSNIFNGFQPVPGGGRILELFPRRCGCDDCEAAVSPAAYLADLLDYTLTYVKINNQAITLDFLTRTFHQPFSRLPASCDAVEEQVRQVRLCVEVLRSYLRATADPQDPAWRSRLDLLATDEATFRRAAFDSLLLQLGTSFAEIRLARHAGAEERQALADRLGIELEHLDDLYLLPADLIEEALERLFGLRATVLANGDLPDPLRNVAEPDLLAWKKAYLRTQWFRQDWPAFPHTEQWLFVADPAYAQELDNQVLSANFLQVFTDHDLAVSPNARVIVLQAGERWVIRDDPDAYFLDVTPGRLNVYVERTLPLIDPDVVGPDDLRNPAAGDPAFDLWAQRRVWVDARLQELEAMTRPVLDAAGNPVQIPDVDQMVQHMSQPVNYNGVDVTPWSGAPQRADLERLLSSLSQGADVEATTVRIEGELRLSVEAFTRLMEVWNRARLWEQEPSREPVSEPEWRELRFILVQAQKTAFFRTWVQEERETPIFFDSRTFWASLSVPMEGDWPPVAASRLPFVDPDLTGRAELPDAPFGRNVITLWNDRKAWLEDESWLGPRRDALRTRHEAAGFDAVLRDVFGDPLPAAFDEVWDVLNRGLAEGDPALVAALERLRTELMLDEVRFRTLMQAREREATLTGRVSVDEWEAVYDILAGVLRRQEQEHQDWAQEEANLGLTYWQAFKAHLPRWRAAAGVRKQWQEALANRNSLPLIEPDLIDATRDFKPPHTQNEGFALYRDRNDRVSQQLDQIRNEPRVPDEPAWLRDRVSQRLGVTMQDLMDVDGEAGAGNNISQRLAQLGLTRVAFNRLLQVYRALDAGDLVRDAEWEDVFAILVQIEKQQQYAAWRDEERAHGITLSPDIFQIPDYGPGRFPEPLPRVLPDWRASYGDRQAWEDSLQARIDQEQAVTEALDSTIRAAEEASLPMLRDALIQTTDAAVPKAKSLADRLLMDTEAGACQMTTRIGQAIETLQGLLSSIRTGQIQDTYSGLEIQDEDFDEKWQWIGSYATWRAAMFVFLYPENIVVPSLRPKKSPAFQKLVNDLRDDSRLTPDFACRAARAFESYFRDVCQLTVEATCQARTRLHRGTCRNRADADEVDLLYMFARGQETNTVYWSAFDPSDSTGYAQTFWTPIERLEKTIKLIGAVPYERNQEQRWVYLFAVVDDDGEQKLAFIRYDLEQQRLDAEPTVLEEMPEDAVTFTAVVKQHQRVANPPHLAIRVPSGAIYDRRLDQAGIDWSEGEWRTLVGNKLGATFNRLEAMVDSGEKSFLIFVSDRADRIRYKEFNEGLLELKPGPVAVGIWREGQFPVHRVFIRGSDQSLYSNDWDAANDTWLGWQSHGGFLTSDPGIISNYAGSIWPNYLFALGQNGELQYLWLDETPTQWRPLGIRGTSRPSASLTPDQGDDYFLDVFVRGEDAALYHRRYVTTYSWTPQTGVRWSLPTPQQAWRRLGGELASAPAISAFNHTRIIDVFSLGADGALLRMEFDPVPGQITNTVSLGGTWTSDPCVVVPNLGGWRFLFIRGEDNGLRFLRYHRTQAGVLQPTEWVELDGEFASTPSGVNVFGAYRDILHILARGRDDEIWHGRMRLDSLTEAEGNTWLGWQTIQDGVLHAGDDQGWVELGTGTWLGAFQWAQGDEVYAFWRDTATTSRYAAIAPLRGVQSVASGQNWIDSLAIHAGGSTSTAFTRLAYTRWRPWLPGFVPYRYRITFQRTGTDLVESETVPIAPRIVSRDLTGRPLVPDPFIITEKMNRDHLQGRRRQLASLFSEADALPWPASILTYIEEAYYFVPLHLALQLQRRRHYISSLDWFRNVYDYSRPVAERKIYHGLVREESLPAVFARDADWLLDPLDPHAIASTRASTYTRFTLLSLVRCFLDFADDEFTRDTSESVPRARVLYETALELLGLPELNQHLGLCSDIIGTLQIDLEQTIVATAPAWAGAWKALVADLGGITNPELLRATTNEVRNALQANRPWQDRFAEAEDLVSQVRAGQPATPDLGALLDAEPERVSRAFQGLMTAPEVVDALDRVGTLAEEDFLQALTIVSAPGETTLPANLELPGAGNASGDGFGLFGRTNGNPTISTTALSPALLRGAIRTAQRTPVPFLPGSVSYDFCIPPNPVLRALRLQAELNLFKLRTCRNIAGMERQLEPYAAPTDTESGLPQIGAGGSLVLPGTVSLQPTAFRYQVLIERAKQLVQLAGQIEAAMLAAFERRDAEAYNLLQARQNVQLARAGVRLQDLRIREAEGGVKLAELQRESAQIQADHYQQLLDGGLSALEQEALALLSTSVDFQYAASAFSFAAAASHAVAAALSWSDFTGSERASLLAAAASSTASGLSSLAGAWSTRSSIASARASYERRAQDWEFQRVLAQQNIRIGNQQVSIAEDHVRVVGQEREIAEMQHDHARDTVEFLTTKFTNLELYDWMSGVMEGVYSFFLQQATATARLAENQLAFERQQIPPAYIQADYWEAPAEDGAGAGTSGQAIDRHGLTGSARLLQDIYQLDQYAFETDRRKQQLVKVLSLASVDPFAFQRFRETGVLPFETPMETFDRDFPGHYLRLIKRVRVSVIALIPPGEGIKATLSATGLSRVVIRSNGLFQQSLIRRPPESVSLSSPSNATGLFELTPQSPELLLPFEGMGVATNWELRMPRASNPFDYSTIADVLVAIEYTALDSFDYRQQVVQELDRSISADRPFSFRHQFADAWYDLHNPDQTATPMTIGWETRRQDFPPNVENLRIQHVVLYFVRAGDASFEIPVTHLHFTEVNAAGAIGGGSGSIDGVISTRRGNAGSWTPMIGKSVIGRWELSLPNTAEVRDRFKDEQIDDILLVITYSGRTPAWPV